MFSARTHTLLGIGWLTLVCATTRADGAIPQIGGGQIGMAMAPMKHVGIMLSGNQLSVEIDTSVPIPQLRPLESPYKFDPGATWSVLRTKAYNFQYGWNQGGFISLPSAAWIWIEQWDATPGLEVYQRPPALPAYAPVFGTADSPSRWRWTGAMAHNVYAVADPTENLYEAFYRVYVGDDTTGEPLSEYASAEVVLQFSAVPKLPGDYDEDGDVDVNDFVVWQDQFGFPGEQTADGNRDGLVDAADYTVWQDSVTAHTASSKNSPRGAPEPTSCALLIELIAIGMGGYRYCRTQSASWSSR
jgi:hypothetical protein